MATCEDIPENFRPKKFRKVRSRTLREDSEISDTTESRVSETTSALARLLWDKNKYEESVKKRDRDEQIDADREDGDFGDRFQLSDDGDYDDNIDIDGDHENAKNERLNAAFDLTVRGRGAPEVTPAGYQGFSPSCTSSERDDFDTPSPPVSPEERAQAVGPSRPGMDTLTRILHSEYGHNHGGASSLAYSYPLLAQMCQPSVAEPPVYHQPHIAMLTGTPVGDRSIIARALASGAPRRSRGEKKPIPDDEKDMRYFERRRRNNVAAKKSRDARKNREDHIAQKADYLEKEHSILAAQVFTLREEANSLKQLLFQKALQKGTRMPEF